MSEQRVALITGASSGLGLEMAREFKKQGFYVLAVSRNPPPVDSYDEFKSCDLGDEAMRNLFLEEVAKLPRIDVLINNAGIGAYGKWDEISEDDLRYIMELDFFAPMFVSRALLPKIKLTKGTIINVASVAAKIPLACMGIYSAAKSALHIFSETLQIEERDVNVLSVLPGRISTGFWNNSKHYRDVPNSPTTSFETSQGLAKRVYKSYLKQRRVLIYPSWYKFGICLINMFPKIYQYLSRKAWKI